MSIASMPALVQAIRQSKLLEGNQLQEFEGLHQGYADPKQFMRELLQRELLTPYQANQIVLGSGKDLVLGPYVLMARTGEGALGQVFKARHRRMNRLVALKVIRADLLARPEAVERFYRESQVISQLSDPHIVHAYDAGPMGQTHFLAMEFVEGVDLENLVQQSGALPVAIAADFILQTAYGLYHAAEKNTPHLDLKPANLLLSRALTAGGTSPSGSSSWKSLLASASGGGTTVKINNFGLTFLQTSGLDAAGAGQGTPDYMAPERAQPGYKPDMRSDLYSLGCIFYFLLTSRVPFPGGTAADKVRRHQTEEPAAIAQFRKDVPPATLKIVSTLMAKKPQARYQTPADVIHALGGKPTSSLHR